MEPVPEGHPFYAMENCLMSFHCADLTDDYFDLTMDCFVQHARRYAGMALHSSTFQLNLSRF